LESMQASLDAETKGRSDLLRQKKKLETEVNELEVAVDHANRSFSDLQKSSKRLQTQIEEQQSQIEDEQRNTAEARDACAAAERNANSILAESEELRAGMEAAERARKSIEMDLHDAFEQISELSSSVANLNAQKRKLENDLAGSQADVEMAASELRAAEENLRKSQADASKLCEELRHESENAANSEKLRKNLEHHVKDLNDRLEQAEFNSLKGGKRIIQKLEQKNPRRTSRIRFRAAPPSGNPEPSEKERQKTQRPHFEIRRGQEKPTASTRHGRPTPKQNQSLQEAGGRNRRDRLTQLVQIPKSAARVGRRL